MDIYLGARCVFCVSNGTGWDSIVDIVRKPMVFVNMVPIGYLRAFRLNQISIFKHHFASESGLPLSLRQIFARGAGYGLQSGDYITNGVSLTENSPEEIASVAFEMHLRLTGEWVEAEGAKALQRQFWEAFPATGKDKYSSLPLHGEVRGYIGTDYLHRHRHLVA